MKTNYEVRYASNPTDAKSYDTTRLRKDFLIERVFVPNEVNMVYSMYDRMIVGGAMPVGEMEGGAPVHGVDEPAKEESPKEPSATAYAVADDAEYPFIA